MYSASEENVDTEHMIKMFTDKNFFFCQNMRFCCRIPAGSDYFKCTNFWGALRYRFNTEKSSLHVD